MYKLVCIDMDGTLLNSKRKISNANRVALKKAYDMGVHIVITTGRIYINAAYYSNLVGVDSPVIAANGGIIKEKNEFIYKRTMSREVNTKILEICNKYKANPRFHTSKDTYDGKSFFDYMNLVFLYEFVLKIKSKGYKVRLHHIKNAKQWTSVFKTEEKEIIKCDIIDKDIEKIKKIKDELKKIESIQVLGAGLHSVEVTHKSVSKGSAVKYLAQRYNIKKEEIITIGDNENDIEMIQYGGLGVAMGNAIEMLKDSADYIAATNDEDGVAKVINEFILNEEK
jgi:Cof subfamily protein (haloacid dehalogenase superfamily)